LYDKVIYTITIISHKYNKEIYLYQRQLNGFRDKVTKKVALKSRTTTN